MAKGAPSAGDVVASNFEILGTAGTGGMGVVYRALDLKLRRTVALKFLPDELNASERDKQRFLQEARTASGLDHPNIGVIYGIEQTADDRTFIAMAYYEGQSLAQRIRSGPLSPGEAADIAIQVLKALEYAHMQGIEHRDVKPSNIMLTRERVAKLVDFGLAHVSQQTASKTHGVSGTVAYMSPEQTLGRGVDCRADIWAAGVVVLEMLNGHNPFSRETVPATVFSILNEPPQISDTVPAGLRQVVYRALAKDPARRYQSCSEMVQELEGVRADLPVAAAADSVADAKAPKRGKETSELRRSRESASASAWSLAPAKPRSRGWGFALAGVAAVLAVSLLFAPVRARIANWFASGPAVGDSGKAAASQDYIAALGYTQRYDKPGNLDRAIATLQEALKADPLFALGYAQLGEAYRMKYQVDRDPKWIDLALANCQRAEQLDTRLPSVYSTLARIHNERGKHDLALQEFHQALDINPRDAAALGGIARSDETAGKLEDAEAGYKKAIAVLPDDWRGYNELGNFYSRQGNYPQAIEAYKQGLAVVTDNAQLYSNLGSAYLDTGDSKFLGDAEQALKRARDINPTYPVFANLAALYLEEKNYPEAVAASQKALQLNDRNYIVWDNLRLAYLGLGDNVKANEATKAERSRLEAAVKLNPQDAFAQSMLADFEALNGNSEGAELRIQTALSLSPNDPQVLLEVVSTYVNLHDRAKTREYIQKAIKSGANVEAIEEDPAFKALKIDLGQKLSAK